ncbi:hypothetical protein EZS27_024198, partial [termite gut metagenome]
PIYLAGYIERMGTGTGDIVSKCLDLGLKQPEFIQDEEFKVILWRPEQDSEGINANNEGVKEKSEGVNMNFEGIKESMQKDLGKIYTHIKNNPLTKSVDIELLIGKSNATVERYLKILKDNKRIEYSGSLKTGGYRIMDDTHSVKREQPLHFVFPEF